jgi:glycosyltransferase involved in cell wall biosynthesis
MSKVTVIIPMFNTEKYITECILSLKNQTFEDYAAFVIDDGSTDNSFEIALKAINGDPRFNLIKQPNSGLSKTKNVGIKLSHSDYIMFLDSDDFIDSRMIELMYENIVNTKSDLCVCNMQQFSLSKKFNGNRYSDEVLSNKLSGILFWMVSLDSSCNKLYKMSLITSYKINFVSKNVFPQEDFLFNYKYLSHSNSVSTITNSLYYYRMRNNSISKRSYNIETLLKSLNLNYHIVNYQQSLSLKNHIDDNFLSFLPIYMHFTAINTKNIRLKHIYHISTISRQIMRNNGSFDKKLISYYSAKAGHPIYYKFILILLKYNLIIVSSIIEKMRVSRLYSAKKLRESYYD